MAHSFGSLNPGLSSSIALSLLPQYFMVGVCSSGGQAENQAFNKQASPNGIRNVDGNGKKDED